VAQWPRQQIEQGNHQLKIVVDDPFVRDLLKNFAHGHGILLDQSFASEIQSFVGLVRAFARRPPKVRSAAAATVVARRLAAASPLLGLQRPTFGETFGAPGDLIEQAVTGDLACRRVLTDSGRAIGQVPANLCNVLNHERVVIGGSQPLQRPLDVSTRHDSQQRSAKQDEAARPCLAHGEVLRADRAGVPAQRGMGASRERSLSRLRASDAGNRNGDNSIVDPAVLVADSRADVSVGRILRCISKATRPFRAGVLSRRGMLRPRRSPQADRPGSVQTVDKRLLGDGGRVARPTTARPAR
jgi:hypothetical protein